MSLIAIPVIEFSSYQQIAKAVFLSGGGTTPIGPKKYACSSSSDDKHGGSLVVRISAFLGDISQVFQLRKTMEGQVGKAPVQDFCWTRNYYHYLVLVLVPSTGRQSSTVTYR